MGSLRRGTPKFRDENEEGKPKSKDAPTEQGGWKTLHIVSLTALNYPVAFCELTCFFIGN